ncbi:MAG: hypothetical protein AAB320_09565 [Elusimicrobiota bacterium]
MIDQGLLRIIRDQFALDWAGIHGASHWARVRENGLRMAETTGAKPKVVELFAFLHDSKRLNDDFDPDHGPRAALFAQSLSGSAFELEPDDLQLLMTACRSHSDGLTTGDITVLTCWDADRLDLGRVGIRPQPERLCTAAARDPGLLEWAYRRSLARKAPLG